MALLNRYWVVINIIIVVVMIAILTIRRYDLFNTKGHRIKKSEQVLSDTKHGMLYKLNKKIRENNHILSISKLENVERLNNHKKYWNFKQKLCDLHQWRLNILESFNFSSNRLEQIEHVLQRFIMDPTDTVCKEKVTYGGVYWSHCHYIDGGKNICMNELIQERAKNECLIVSFGIANDWTF